jgi:hypothetical protein
MRNGAPITKLRDAFFAPDRSNFRGNPHGEWPDDSAQHGYQSTISDNEEEPYATL